jgi:hypothetical protein
MNLIGYKREAFRLVDQQNFSVVMTSAPAAQTD